MSSSQAQPELSPTVCNHCTACASRTLFIAWILNQGNCALIAVVVDR